MNQPIDHLLSTQIDRLTSRAAELADMPMDTLRLEASGCEKLSDARKEFGKWKRGEMVRHILNREFLEESFILSCIEQITT